MEKLDPELDQFSLVRPYLLKSVAKNYDPLKMGRKVINSMYEIGSYMEEFPRDLKNAVRKINSGMVKVDLTHKGIDPMVHTLQRVVKQLVTALIMTALIIGATLLEISKVKPLWGNYSVWAILSLVITIFLAYGMIRYLKKGDHDEYWMK